MPHMKRLLSLLLFIGSLSSAQRSAYEPLISNQDLYEFAEFSNVGNLDLTLDELQRKKNLIFLPIISENQSLGFTSDHFWIRFKLKNSSEDDQVYYLETARPITDEATLYQIGPEETQVFESGDQIPFDERQVEHRLTIFKVELPAKSEQQFYLNLSSDGETINVPLNLYTESEFWKVNYKQQLFLGLFFGLLFLAGLVYLFFFSSLKNKTFLYYSLYVFSIGFMQAALDGFIYQYFLSDGGFLNSRTVLITALMSNFFLLKYCEYFLKVSVQLPAFKKAYRSIYIVIGVLFAMLFMGSKSLELVYPISNLNGLVSLILILTTIFVMRYRKLEIDKYFSIGIFFLVIGLLGFVMNNLSLLPNNFYTLNSAKFGTAFEVIFLSLSMTNLIRQLRMEKEGSQLEALNKSQEISQLKTYFMSNMSHELRTPINAIMGVTELELANAENSKNSRKQFEIIKNASLSLLSHVNDILDFEKIEKNELKLKQEEFNPSIAINQISNNWKTEATKKGLDYSFEMDPEIPARVMGDSERFVQIINNVLSNAVKFTETGRVQLKLKCIQHADSWSKFSIQISDTGIGMNSGHIETVFDSFSQMRLDHKRQFGGIGLGLSIVKHLVHLFDGSISIDSEINKGTDVFVEIPLKIVSTKPREIDEISYSQDSVNQHVLVVEDNKLNQMVMKKLLSNLSNITFSVVNNGEEALEALKKDVYDVVLMDLQMPVMDGYEATKIIRSGNLGSDIEKIPIIAVTADAMQETEQRVLDLGMNDYMTKPVNKEVLLKKINEFKKQAVLQIA